MLETTKYIRKPFNIDAVQVTHQNMQEIAQWVDGQVLQDELGPYVKVRVHRPLNDRQTKAYVNDWVLYAGTGYKVYTEKAFKNSFEQVSGETTLIDVSNTKTGAKRLVENDEVVKVVEGNVVKPVRKKAVANG